MSPAQASHSVVCRWIRLLPLSQQLLPHEPFQSELTPSRAMLKVIVPASADRTPIGDRVARSDSRFASGSFIVRNCTVHASCRVEHGYAFFERLGAHLPCGTGAYNGVHG